MIWRLIDMGAGIDFWMFDRMMDMSGGKGGSGDDYYNSIREQTREQILSNPYPYRGCPKCEKLTTCEEVRIWREMHYKDWCPEGAHNE